MTKDKRQLQEKQLQQMHKAASGLDWSLQRCQPLTIDALDAEGEEKFETLTARDFIVIRELRNAIAHEYEEEALADIHREVLRLTPLLLSTPDRSNQYLNSRFPKS